MRASPFKQVSPTLVAVVLAVVLGGAVPCQGSETLIDVFRKFFTHRVPAPPEAAGDWAPLAGENQYTPLLKKLLGAELHFVRKVCTANDAQIEEFRELGLTKVQELAGQYAKMQNRQASEWPDARTVLTDAFIEKCRETFPEETAEQYRVEISARREAQKEAALAMMITIADRRLMLTAEQSEKIREGTVRKWEPGWSRTMQVFLYDDYAPRPPDDVLDGVLNERQRTVLKSGRNYGRISFGWEQDLGLMPFWGDDGTVLEDVK